VSASTVFRGLTVAALALAVPGLANEASAQNVGVRSFLSPGSTVGLGAQFLLNVEITGTRELDGDPELPDLTAFAQYLGSGTSTSMQMTGAQTTVSLTIQYRFQALEEGTFSILPVVVRSGGAEYSTEPLELTVTSAPPPQTGGQQPQTEAEVVAPTDLFVTAEPSRRRVREGEPFVVEYRIWTRVDVTSYGITRLPEFEGFWMEELTEEGSPQVEQRMREDGQYATALIRRVALVPTGPGPRTLEPLGVEAQVRVRRPGRDPFQDLFGRSSLFGSAVVPAAVLSNEVTIQVDPLPPGPPEPFSGMVGSLDVTASLDRDSVDANEAVTLSVRVSGEGNVRTLPEPVLELPADFEVFPPEVSESVRPSRSGLAGSKTYTYVLIPRAPGNRTIPAISMGYFDLGAGTYRTAASPELDLTVTGVVADGPVTLTRGGVTQLREDIRFIHLGSAGLRPARGVLFREGSFWLLALLPMAAVLGALGLRRHRDRLEGDVAYARARRAGRVAKQHLSQARHLATGDDPRTFYAEVGRALRGFVADKLNVSAAGLQVAGLRADLQRRRVSGVTADELLDCLEETDRQRFAPPGSDRAERRRVLQRAGAVMTALDKELRR
jgi:hypothetical protein